MQVLEVQAGLLSHREVLSIIQSDMQEASEAAEAYKRRRIQQRDALKAMGKFGVGFRDAELSKLISPSNVVEIQKLVSSRTMWTFLALS